jgi:hypothetical protein
MRTTFRHLLSNTSGENENGTTIRRTIAEAIETQTLGAVLMMATTKRPSGIRAQAAGGQDLRPELLSWGLSPPYSPDRNHTTSSRSIRVVAMAPQLQRPLDKETGGDLPSVSKNDATPGNKPTSQSAKETKFMMAFLVLVWLRRARFAARWQ